MSACAICLDLLKSPVALPCGHVYCHTCISEAAKATTSTSSSIIYCPTCREPVSTITPNPLFIPPHLRPYIIPPFRRLYLNTPAPTPDRSVPVSSTSTEELEKVTTRLHMENAVLRQSCHAWRARANAHVAAHLGLSALVRLARDQACILRDERDELARKYDALKRKFSDVDRESKPRLDEGENGLNWAESAPQDHDETKIFPPTDNVPCEPLVCPVEELTSVPHPVPQRNAKRRRVSSTSLHPEHPAKSATSIPAMVIPHLVSHRPTPSESSTLSDS